MNSLSSYYIAIRSLGSNHHSGYIKLPTAAPIYLSYLITNYVNIHFYNLNLNFAYFLTKSTKSLSILSKFRDAYNRIIGLQVYKLNHYAHSSRLTLEQSTPK